MRVRQWVVLLCGGALLGFLGCGSFGDNSRPLTDARRAAIEDGVRQFTATVAHDVTQDGPIAWSKFFAEGPEFFMAVNGKVAFADGQSAAKMMPEIARQFKHIELRWGNDLRLDALTENLCNVATSYTENIELQPGVDGFQGGMQSGYFTGLAESRNGHWQFRNAHWSAPVAPAKAP
jgi:hypothetical protein